MNFTFRPVLETGPVQWSWITLVGADAQDFLHRLTTVHVKALNTGQGSNGCFLTPQGKIRAYFTLWNVLPNEYAFEFDAGLSGNWKAELLAVIDQYTFAEKMTLTDLSLSQVPAVAPSVAPSQAPALECRWIFPNEEGLKAISSSPLEPYQTILIPHGSQENNREIRVCYHGDKDYLRPWLTVWGSPGSLDPWIARTLPQGETKEADFSQIEDWRVAALRPRIDTEITHSSVPLEVGLRDAIADQKGCYPGQEVIEKIISLGSPPKRLIQIEGAGAPPHPGEKILNLEDPPLEVGQVTSISSGRDGKFAILGFVKKIHAKEGLSVQFSENRSSKGAIVKVAPYA